MNQPPSILALDFDGVLCDGLVEYFQTAWQAYCQLFGEGEKEPPAGLAERFYPLRPVIETGWEMPLLLHALQAGVEDQVVLEQWPSLVQTIVQKTQIAPPEAMAAVDGIRDRWMQRDLDQWLSLHRFYPGVIDWLQRTLATGVYPLIISTKEGRFIQKLLAQAGIPLPAEQILGKEVQQPKTQTLRQLLQSPPEGTDSTRIWFIEDRLKTLEKVEGEPDLGAIALFLADWGYNTAAEKAQAQRDPRIHLLSLSQLVREFSDWPSTATP